MNSDLTTWITGGANLGAFIVLVWLVRHTFKFTIPRLAKDFKEELQLQRETFTEELRTERESFNEQLSTQREQFREELHAERSVLGGKIDKLKESVDDVLKGKR